MHLGARGDHGTGKRGRARRPSSDTLQRDDGQVSLAVVETDCVTAIGSRALANNTTGNNNIAIGQAAAQNVSGGNSNNIHIGSLGLSADSGTIRIGDSTPQTRSSPQGFVASRQARTTPFPS